MATTVYIPPVQSPWESLGLGIGQFLDTYGTEAAKQKKMVKMQALVQGIQEAPSREEAQRLVASSTGLLETPQELAGAYGLVNEIHPATENSPIHLSAYRTDTGEQTSVFVPKSAAVGISQPGAFEQMYPGLSLTKPNVDKYYKYQEGGKSEFLGYFTPDKVPEGAMTQIQINEYQQERARQDLIKRYEQLQENFITSQARADARAAASQDRMDARLNKRLDREKPPKTEENLRIGQATLEKLAAPSGSILRPEVYLKATELLPDLISGGLDGMTAATRAWKLAGGPEEDTPTPAAKIDTGTKSKIETKGKIKQGGTPEELFAIDLSIPKGSKLGNKTSKGYEVKDKYGRLIGHWNP